MPGLHERLYGTPPPRREPPIRRRPTFEEDPRPEWVRRAQANKLPFKELTGGSR